MKNIVIQGTLKVLKKLDGESNVLSRTGESISSGTRIQVGEEETAVFVSREVPVLPVTWEGMAGEEARYVLKAEYQQALM